MDYDPDFSQKSNAELNSCLIITRKNMNFIHAHYPNCQKEKNWQMIRSHLNFPRPSFGADSRQSLRFLEHYL